jgi:glycosyltransferase involved in cell wall biosynthesis
MDIPDNVEILYIDDGSDPPILTVDGCELKNFHIHHTYDSRPWTWALARNKGALIAEGDYLLMTDLDYIIPKSAIDDALDFNGDYMGFRRQFGILDENGNFTQDFIELHRYGLSNERIKERGVDLPPHPNNFVIKKDLFFAMGGYREDRVGMEYPQGEDNWFKKTRHQWVREGKLIESTYRPTLYMFPNGRWCGDVDHNPFGLFHNLSRKSNRNPFYERS